MPKKIGEELKARAVQLVTEHRGEYSSLTAAAVVVAKAPGDGEGVGPPLMIQSQIVDGQRRSRRPRNRPRSRR